MAEVSSATVGNFRFKVCEGKTPIVGTTGVEETGICWRLNVLANVDWGLRLTATGNDAKEDATKEAGMTLGGSVRHEVMESEEDMVEDKGRG